MITVLKEAVVNEEEIGVSSASPRWMDWYRVGRWGYVAAVTGGLRFHIQALHPDLRPGAPRPH